MRVLMFHKPRGLVTTTSDERGRRTVFDALPPWVRDQGFVPVGRLDMDSRGLLLFTDDRSAVEPLGAPGRLKTYEVWVRGRVLGEHVAAAISGVESAVGTLKAVSIEIKGMNGPKTRLAVTLDEGKNRHIRRMFGAMTDPGTGTPLKVMDLKRVSFGAVVLDVPSGQWRFLTQAEIDSL